MLTLDMYLEILCTKKTIASDMVYLALQIV